MPPFPEIFKKKLSEPTKITFPIYFSQNNGKYSHLVLSQVILMSFLAILAMIRAPKGGLAFDAFNSIFQDWSFLLHKIFTFNKTPQLQIKNEKKL